MTTTTTPSSTTTTKYCPCVLCGATIVATTEDDCLAHMQVCSTFHQVHPEGRATNAQAIYTTTKTSTPTTTTQKKKDSNYTNLPSHAGNIIDQGERDTENVHSSNSSSATMALPPSAPTITIATAAAAAASPTNNSNNEDEMRTAAAARGLPSESSRGGVEVEHLSVAQLRRYIQQAGLASDDCLEKSELQHRAHEATVRTSQNPFQ